MAAAFHLPWPGLRPAEESAVDRGKRGRKDSRVTVEHRPLRSGLFGSRKIGNLII